MDIDHESSESMSEPSRAGTIAQKISSGELTLKETKGRSKVWEVYAKIIGRDGVPVKDFVSCKNCKKLLKYNNFSTSNLVKHKCYLVRNRLENIQMVEVDESTKKNVTKIMTEWVIKDCRPFNLVKDDGLQAILKEFTCIGAKYGPNVDIEKALPHPTTISRNIGNIYEVCLLKTKAEISLIEPNGFGLTTDVWTDDYIKRSYIALTIHFVNEGVLSVRLLGLTSMEGERCTSENIFKKVERLLMNFGCNFSSKAVIVTDRGSNMKKAFQNTQHLSCMSHLLNNTLHRSMEDVIEVAELNNHSAKLVKYFKKSGLNANLRVSLKSYCPTRWNTTFYMLTSIEENWGEINQLLQNKNQLNRIDLININHLKAITKILQPFEEASKHLEGENYATLHLAPIYLHQLKSACEPDSCDVDFLRTFKEKLFFYLETLVSPHVTIMHKIALFLFPPTNKLLQFTDNEKQSIYDECIRLLKSFPTGPQTMQEGVAASSSPMSKYKKLFSGFVEDESPNDSDEMFTQEMQLYKNTRVANSASFNVYKWWDLQKTNFPSLYKLSCIVLATPASSASSERVFSAAKNLLCEKRSILSFNELAIEQIMFIHFNNDKN